MSYSEFNTENTEKSHGGHRGFREQVRADYREWQADFCVVLCSPLCPLYY
jgi:hypothetical protein